MTTLFGKKMCESCFSENSGDPCSKCGFSAAEYHPDSTALPIGQKLQERYLIGGVIGKGGFGITYTAFDEKLERRVAVKEYYPYGLALRTPGTTMVSAPDTDSEDVFSKGAEKFYDEARLVAKFSGNQNIVNVFDFFYENSTVYYVMEYLQGQSMKKYIEKHGTVSEGQAVCIAMEVSNALVASHSANVLHRDISPDNIMLCSDGKVKLIDFGAARQVLSEGSQSLSVILKQGFAPIEQYQKKGKQGPWTDIYALGATLYYIVTGDLLDDPMSRLDDDEEFSSNPHGINEGLWEIIKKATMLKIGDRYKDIFEFRADLNKISLDSVPLTISYDDSVEMLPNTASLSDGATMPVKEAAPIGATMPVKEAAPIGATMPVKETAPVGATMPVKEAAPISATIPVKEAAPIGATMPVKEAAPIGATMPVKEAAPVGATMPVKEAAPIGATMPVKEAAPIGATMPVKEQTSKEKKTDFTDKYGDEEWRLEAKRAASAAAYERRQQDITQGKKKLLIVLSIVGVIIIAAICIFFGTHVKVGDSWHAVKDNTVYISSEHDISDLSSLTKKENIYRVSFYRCSFSDPSVLEELKELTKLEHLELYSNNISDISPLKELTKLEHLDLYSNNISDISPLKELTKLEFLDLSSNNISDISPLKELTKLKHLNLASNNISDISPLKELTKLEYLDLTLNYNIYNIYPLKGLTILEHLDLYSNNISDISPLKELTKLEFLDLSYNKISDISPLKELTNLDTLKLEYNGESYWLYSAEEIKEFLDENIKTDNSQAEAEKPAEPKKPTESEKPAETEPTKPPQTEPEKPTETEPAKPPQTEPEKPAETTLTYEQHVENMSRVYKEKLASIDDAISYCITEMDGNGDPTYDIGNNYRELIVLAGDYDLVNARYEFYRYDDYRQKAIYMGEVTAFHASLAWSRSYGYCLCTLWQGFTVNRIIMEDGRIDLENEPVVSISMFNADIDFDAECEKVMSEMGELDMTPADDLSQLTVEKLSDSGLE